MKTIRILNCSQTRGVYFLHKPSGWKSCALTTKIWRNGRMTRFKVCPNQLNRLQRTEKLHRLKSQPIFSEAFQTQPVHRRCFIFLFVPFGNIGERARKKKFQLIPSILFFPHLYPLCWRSTNPPRFLFLSRPLDGLWREIRGSLNRPFQREWREHLIFLPEFPV